MTELVLFPQYNDAQGDPPDVAVANADGTSVHMARRDHVHKLHPDVIALFAPISHAHAGEDITSGTVADARIASTITRDSEVFGIVLAVDGSGSGLDADVVRATTPGATGLAMFAAATQADGRSALGLGTIATATETGYLLVSGARAGAASGAQEFTLGVITGHIRPAADSTTAIRFFKADGATAIGTWDTTNSRFGIGVTPTSLFHIRGTSVADGSAPVTLTVDDTLSSSGWTVGAPYAQLSFASQDTSGAGAGTKAKIAAVMEVANGGSAALAFFTTNSTAGLVEKLRLSAAGNLGLLSGNLGVGVQTAADNIEINKPDPKLRFTDNDAATFSDFNGGFDFYATATRVGFLTYSAGVMKFGTQDTGASVDIRTGNNVVRLAIGNTGDFAFNTNQVFLQQSTASLMFGGTSPTAFLDLPASTTARASQRIRSGVAPTSPNDGDLWYPTGGRLTFRRGSTTEIIPSIASPATYTPTNVTTDRAFDADSTTVDELADVLGTLIADLKTSGIIV